MVFLPTYFTMTLAYNQAALLAFCLLLNATITALCIHLPKIYAVNYVDEGQLKFAGSAGVGVGHGTGFSFSESIHSTHTGRKSNQIQPVME